MEETKIAEDTIELPILDDGTKVTTEIVEETEEKKPAVDLNKLSPKQLKKYGVKIPTSPKNTKKYAKQSKTKRKLARQARKRNR